MSKQSAPQSLFPNPINAALGNKLFKFNLRVYFYRVQKPLDRFFVCLLEGHSSNKLSQKSHLLLFLFFKTVLIFQNLCTFYYRKRTQGFHMALFQCHKLGHPTNAWHFWNIYKYHSMKTLPPTASENRANYKFPRQTMWHMWFPCL